MSLEVPWIIRETASASEENWVDLESSGKLSSKFQPLSISSDRGTTQRQADFAVDPEDPEEMCGHGFIFRDSPWSCGLKLKVILLSI